MSCHFPKMITPWGDHFGKISGWSQIYFLIYDFLVFTPVSYFMHHPLVLDHLVSWETQVKNVNEIFVHVTETKIYLCFDFYNTSRIWIGFRPNISLKTVRCITQLCIIFRFFFLFFYFRWKCHLFGFLGSEIWTVYSSFAFLFEFGSIDGSFVGWSIV